MIVAAPPSSSAICPTRLAIGIGAINNKPITNSFLVEPTQSAKNIHLAGCQVPTVCGYIIIWSQCIR